MTKYLSWTVIVAIGLQVAGCYTDYGPVQVAGPPPAREVTVTRLQPGDRVKVIIYGEDNLSGTYDIDSAGYISMPFAPRKPIRNLLRLSDRKGANFWPLSPVARVETRLSIGR